MGATRSYDEVFEGDELGPVELHLPADQVRAYARAADIYFPRFTDDEAAKREGLPGMIAPGNMSMGLLTTLVDRWAGPGGLRRLGTTFRAIVRPDRTLRLHGAVTEKHDETRTVEVDVWIESDEGDRLVIGTATVALA